MEALKLQRKYPEVSRDEMFDLINRFKCVPSCSILVEMQTSFTLVLWAPKRPEEWTSLRRFVLSKQVGSRMTSPERH